MKIVHICLTGGYTEGYAYQENYLAKYHVRMGNEVTIITTQYCWHKDEWGSCLDSDYINKDGVKVIRIPYKYNICYRINTFIGRFKGLYDLFNTIKPDFIFVHNLQFNDVDQIVKYKKNNMNVKIVVDNHSDFSNSARNWLAKNILYKLYWRRNAKKLASCVERFYGVIPARVDFLKDVYLLPEQKCKLLVMGADDDEVERVADKNIRKNVREHIGVSSSDFVIVTGGKIDAWKRQTLLLMKAVHIIKQCTVKLIIFGKVAADIKDEFDSLCDGEKVKYIGWADSHQSYEYFSIADLVVFPGRHSVYWEQVAGMGIPMICKYWEGTTHVDCGGNVKFIKKDDIDEIKGLIEQCVYNKEEFEAMKSAAKDSAYIFSYKNIAARSIDMSE